MHVIDLRSDTVTRPTAKMREVMAHAEVGDDVFGEDPTVRRLEATVAEITGKEAALFVTSGTLGNQIALLCQTKRGDEIVAGEGAHLSFYECGAAAAWSGVQVTFAGSGGLYTAADLARAMKAPDAYNPRTSLVAIENTHNRAGGRVFPQSDVLAIAEVARKNGLALHLDGARVWNAAAATGRSVAEIAAPFDTASVCFSKGLGAPVGSALAGSAELIRAARRFRKMMGGGMRQAGILAAAALYALEHHRARLVEDHAAARAIANAARALESKGARVIEPETNVLIVETPGVPATKTIEAAARRGVLLSDMGPERVRAVTHLDLRSDDVPRVATAFAASLEEALGGAR